MKRLFFLVAMFISVIGAAQNNTGSPQAFVKEVSVSDFGKCITLPKKFYRISRIKKAAITSCFYIYADQTDKKIFIPVNDSRFNYEYFHKNIYPFLEKGKKVRLTVRKYKVDGKDILVAEHIE